MHFTLCVLDFRINLVKLFQNVTQHTVPAGSNFIGLLTAFLNCRIQRIVNQYNTFSDSFPIGKETIVNNES